MSWLARILPYVEQNALWAQTDRAFPKDRVAFHNPPHVGLDTVITLYICPSDGRIATAQTSFGYHVAFTSYLGNLGENYRDEGGVLFRDSHVRLTEVSDGTSNTLLITEDAGRPNVFRASGTTNGRFSGGGWADRDNEFITHGFTADGKTNPGPCAVNCTNDNEIYAFHTGGANIVFGDGSVHFLSSSVDIRIVAALITRAGGEVVPGDF